MLELSVDHILDVATQELPGISSIQLFQRIEFIVCFILSSARFCSARSSLLMRSEQASTF